MLTCRSVAGTDDVLAPATKGFLDTAAFNLLRVVEQAAVNLPPFADAQDIAVEIEASEPEIVDDSNQLSSGADRRQLVDC